MILTPAQTLTLFMLIHADELDAETLLNPLIQIFNAIVNMVKAPFVAITHVWNNWAGSVSGLGIWAPVIAVMIFIITLLVLYFGNKLRTYLP